MFNEGMMHYMITVEISEKWAGPLTRCVCQFCQDCDQKKSKAVRTKEKDKITSKLALKMHTAVLTHCSSVTKRLSTHALCSFQSVVHQISIFLKKKFRKKKKATRPH